MKKLVFLMILIATCMVASAAAVAGDDPKFSIVPWLTANAAEILIGLLAFIKVVVRLTPSVKDDYVFGKIDSFIAWFVPNMGGKTAIKK